MLKQITNEEFIKKAVKIHAYKYDYSKVIYINAKTKVIIICKIHGEFLQRPDNHLHNTGCNYCSINNKKLKLKKTNEQFIKDAIKIHNNKYDYSKVEYINNNTKIIIICKIHGEFFQSPVSHLSNHGCSLCKFDNLSIIFKKTQEEFIKDAIKIHNYKYDYSKVEYINNNTKIIIICKIHHEFLQSPIKHLNTNGCPKCANELKSLKFKKDINIFIKESNILYKNKYDYSNSIYINNKTKIKIICDIHGEFEQTPSNHFRYVGCAKCSKSQFSKSQIKWLEFLEKYYNINIQHIGNSNQEHRIKNTRWKADGYCKETNTIYEFHGDYWHGNPKCYLATDKNNVSNKTMGYLYKKTLEREQKIKDIGYNLVVIWEYDWNKINKSVKKLQKPFRKC
jgi:G:T-mismatch repair DNA endonuclease (very short patch repair protein)